MDYDFTAGDTGSKIKVQILDARTAKLIVPFSGLYTAALYVKPQGGVAVKRNMTVLTGADDGYAEYLLLGTELVEGITETQTEITRVSDSAVFTELKIKEWRVGPSL